MAGKKITHVRISLERHKDRFDVYGLPPVWTQILLEMEKEFADNEEARPENGEVLRLTGSSPLGFREWAEKNKAMWA